MRGQREGIEWQAGDVPVSTRFDDPYFSRDNGLEETTHVFLAGNGLPGRFCDGFHIGELGFGTGLNLLATLDLWRKTNQQGMLHFTAFEAYPMLAGEMIRAQGAFPALAGIAAEFAPYWVSDVTQIALPDLKFTLITGDARDTLPKWPGRADAWFLDGFSPAKNPELWQPDLMQEVGAHSSDTATAATYTAAGFVRRGLEGAGFTITRAPGYGRKRHMTIATKTPA